MTSTMMTLSRPNFIRNVKWSVFACDTVQSLTKKQQLVTYDAFKREFKIILRKAKQKGEEVDINLLAQDKEAQYDLAIKRTLKRAVSCGLLLQEKEHNNSKEETYSFRTQRSIKMRDSAGILNTDFVAQILKELSFHQFDSEVTIIPYPVYFSMIDIMSYIRSTHLVILMPLERDVLQELVEQALEKQVKKKTVKVNKEGSKWSLHIKNQMVQQETTATATGTTEPVLPSKPLVSTQKESVKAASKASSLKTAIEWIHSHRDRIDEVETVVPSPGSGSSTWSISSTTVNAAAGAVQDFVSVSAAPEKSVPVNTNSSTLSSMPVQRRGRGRPRKYPIVAAVAKSANKRIPRARKTNNPKRDSIKETVPKKPETVVAVAENVATTDTLHVVNADSTPLISEAEKDHQSLVTGSDTNSEPSTTAVDAPEKDNIRQPDPIIPEPMEKEVVKETPQVVVSPGESKSKRPRIGPKSFMLKQKRLQDQSRTPDSDSANVATAAENSVSEQENEIPLPTSPPFNFDFCSWDMGIILAPASTYFTSYSQAAALMRNPNPARIRDVTHQVLKKSVSISKQGNLLSEFLKSRLVQQVPTNATKDTLGGEEPRKEDNAPTSEQVIIEPVGLEASSNSAESLVKNNFGKLLQSRINDFKAIMFRIKNQEQIGPNSKETDNQCAPDVGRDVTDTLSGSTSLTTAEMQINAENEINEQPQESVTTGSASLTAAEMEIDAENDNEQPPEWLPIPTSFSPIAQVTIDDDGDIPIPSTSDLHGAQIHIPERVNSDIIPQMMDVVVVQEEIIVPVSKNACDDRIILPDPNAFPSNSEDVTLVEDKSDVQFITQLEPEVQVVTYPPLIDLESPPPVEQSSPVPDSWDADNEINAARSSLPTIVMPKSFPYPTGDEIPGLDDLEPECEHDECLNLQVCMLVSAPYLRPKAIVRMENGSWFCLKCAEYVPLCDVPEHRFMCTPDRQFDFIFADEEVLAKMIAESDTVEYKDGGK